MKYSKKTLALLLAVLPAISMAAVTKPQLGQMLLGPKYQAITQDYNVYYAQGPTGPNSVGGYHPGVDYRAAVGTPLYSPIEGVVTEVGGPYGTLSIKKNGSDTRIIVMHLSRFDVKKGQNVQIGCQIGLSGKVNTKDPHLHVEARINKDGGAYYFKTKNDQGSNKSPETIPASFVKVASSKKCN